MLNMTITNSFPSVAMRPCFNGYPIQGKSQLENLLSLIDGLKVGQHNLYILVFVQTDKNTRILTKSDRRALNHCVEFISNILEVREPFKVR